MANQQWNKQTVIRLYELPFIDLLCLAQATHKQFFSANEIELCTLLSIKTGACPEDCAYCPQSGHYQTGLTRETVLPLEQVIAKAKYAKEQGATRFCMGAAWRSPTKKGLAPVIAMIREVKNLGLETCATLGMLDREQAQQLKEAGLDFYNHNLDTSPAYYEKIITTRTYQQRLDTLHEVKTVGLGVCSGGILGMGESPEDRIELLLQLANLPEPPESIPINRLIPIKGTPLEHSAKVDNFEFIRIIALARLMMPKASIRLSAGRMGMSEEMQTLCFMAGANSMWIGDKLLTTSNPDQEQDNKLLKKLGLSPKKGRA